jgi:hypothetical protein
LNIVKNSINCGICDKRNVSTLKSKKEKLYFVGLVYPPLFAEEFTLFFIGVGIKRLEI